MGKNLSFNEFAPLSELEWRERIIAETGTPNLNELASGSALNINPLHTQRESSYLPHYERNEWTIVHPHGIINDEEEDNASILKALIGGANGVYLSIDKDINWDKLLTNIELEYISLFVFCNEAASIKSLENHISKRYLKDHPAVFYCCKESYSGLSKNGVRFSGIDLFPYETLSPALILGLAIAQCHDMLQSGTEPKDIWYTLPTFGHYFTNIILLRALFQLHHYLLEKNDHNQPPDPFIFVRSSMRNKSTDDVYDNMIRNTAEGMGAIVGGAQALCIEPHNAVTGKIDNFGYRVARNAQLIFQYEAHLNAQLDPASGSYFFENQTRDLANEAWDAFRAIEQKGGYLQMNHREEMTTFIKTYKSK